MSATKFDWSICSDADLEYRRKEIDQELRVLAEERRALERESASIVNEEFERQYGKQVTPAATGRTEDR